MIVVIILIECTQKSTPRPPLSQRFMDINYVYLSAPVFQACGSRASPKDKQITHRAACPRTCRTPCPHGPPARAAAARAPACGSPAPPPVRPAAPRDAVLPVNNNNFDYSKTVFRKWLYREPGLSIWVQRSHIMLPNGMCVTHLPHVKEGLLPYRARLYKLKACEVIQMLT